MHRARGENPKARAAWMVSIVPRGLDAIQRRAVLHDYAVEGHGRDDGDAEDHGIDARGLNDATAYEIRHFEPLLAPLFFRGSPAPARKRKKLREVAWQKSHAPGGRHVIFLLTIGSPS